MNMRIAVSIVTLLLQTLRLSGQEVESIDKPKPKPKPAVEQTIQAGDTTQAKVKPGQKGKGKGKATSPAAPLTAVPVQGNGQALPTSLPPGMTLEDLKKLQGKQSGGEAKRGAPATPAAPVLPAMKLPPLYDFGTFCLATTKFLQENGRINPWKATLSPHTPSSIELKGLQSMAGVQPAIFPYCRMYNIMGSNYLGRNRSQSSFGITLINGPGFVKAMFNREIQTGEIKQVDGEECVVFSFANHLVTFWPVRKPDEFPDTFIVGFQNGSLVNYNRGSGNTLVPFNTSGILAITMSEHEASGLFRFPLSDFTVPVRGIRKGNEVWLEADQQRQLAWFYWRETYVHSPGIGSVESMKTLRLKIKLKEPRRIDICYVARGYDDQLFKIGNDLHEESTLSLSVSGAKIVDLDALREPFVKNFNTSPSWKVDDGQEGFMFQADSAFAKAGLVADIWANVGTRGSSDPYNKDWDSNRRSQIRKAENLNMNFKQANPPPQ